MDESLKTIGDRVRKVRMEHNMTQDELAEAIGVSPSFVSQIELGKQSMNTRVLIACVQKLGVSADWLIGNSSSSSLQYDAEKLSKELETCTPAERESIVRIVQVIHQELDRLKLNRGK